MIDYDLNRLLSLGFNEEFVQKMKDDPCWAGYEAVGMKKKGKKMVPNCVPVAKQSKHSEGDIATAEMTPNYLPSEPGKGDEKNPQMREGVPIRMPRMEEIEKAANKNGTLAMRARPNYSESEEYHEGMFSMEPNGRMAINQLRVMREKIDIMLGMLYPDDNLEPWMATKLSMSAQSLASVADYMRFGVEFSEGDEEQSIAEKKAKIKSLQSQGHPASILIKQVRDKS
jgi:hypothetical protein